MRYVRPSVLEGTVASPPSKSQTLRAAAAAFLSRQTTDIGNASSCEDAQHAFRLIEKMGAAVELSGEETEPTRARIRGGHYRRNGRVFCGESGLALRMFTPIFSLFAGPIRLEASGSLRSRPVRMIEKPLAQLGARAETIDGFPPVTVWGPLRGGHADVDGSASSQFLTGLLLALPLVEQDSTVTVGDLKSRSYIGLTLDVIRAFGGVIQTAPDLSEFRIPGGQSYRADSFRVEGDWSGAAALLVAGALAGRVEVTGLDPDSCQPDRAVVAALSAAGAAVRVARKAVVCEKSDLRPFEFDVGECPDLFPPLAALAARCPGTSRILGTGRLRHKESARDRVIREEFASLGVETFIEGECVRIRGGRIRGGRGDARGDHRIAMALALAGIASETGVAISGPECVAKSYPLFFKDLARLGGRIS